MLAAMYAFVLYLSKINLTRECQESMLALVLGFSAFKELLLHTVLDSLKFGCLWTKKGTKGPLWFVNVFFLMSQKLTTFGQSGLKKWD
jgi:hypothetical protein